MSNIEKIADDIIRQLDLHNVTKSRAFIQVYTAVQNLTPVIETFLAMASKRYRIPFDKLDKLDNFLYSYFGHRVNIVQKPPPYPERSNHLLLTVGGITAIIFDYEEHKYD